MKKLVFATFAAIVSATCAYASDGGVYLETQTVYSDTTNYTYAQTTGTNIDTRPATRRMVVGHRPCPCNRTATIAAEPVAVKTYTEVIDHYQVYQPVVEYVPAGTYTTRRIVSRTRPCDM